MDLATRLNIYQVSKKTQKISEVELKHHHYPGGWHQLCWLPRTQSFNEVFHSFISSLQVVQCPGKMLEAARHLGVRGLGDIQREHHLVLCLVF